MDVQSNAKSSIIYLLFYTIRNKCNIFSVLSSNFCFLFTLGNKDNFYFIFGIHKSVLVCVYFWITSSYFMYVNHYKKSNSGLLNWQRKKPKIFNT